MTEGDREECLGCNPAVGDHSYEVLRRERLKDGNKKVDHMFVLRILGFEKEVLVMKNNLTVNVFHINPESLVSIRRKTIVSQLIAF